MKAPVSAKLFHPRVSEQLKHEQALSSRLKDFPAAPQLLPRHAV